MSRHLLQVSMLLPLAELPSLSIRFLARHLSMFDQTKIIASSSSKSAIIHRLVPHGPSHQSGHTMENRLLSQSFMESPSTSIRWVLGSLSFDLLPEARKSFTHGRKSHPRSLESLPAHQ